MMHRLMIIKDLIQALSLNNFILISISSTLLVMDGRIMML